MEFLKQFSKFFLIGFILTLVTTLFHLIALAAPYWVYYDVSGAKVNSGLWMYCYESSSASTCGTVSSVNSDAWVRAVQATSILGFFLLIATIVCNVVKMTIKRDNRKLVMASIGTTFGAVLFIFLTIAIYAANVNSYLSSLSNSTYHFGFVFCILAMLVDIGAGVMFILDIVKGK